MNSPGRLRAVLAGGAGQVVSFPDGLPELAVCTLDGLPELVGPPSAAVSRAMVAFSQVPDLNVTAGDVLLPLAVTLVASLVVLVLGAVITLGLGTESARATADATIETPGAPFAVGFVLLFAPLTGGAMLLVAGNPLPGPLPFVFAVASLLPLLLGFIWLVVGAAFGVVVLGRLVGRRNGDPSAWRSLLLGTAVFGALLIVPVVGYVAAVAVSTLGGGSLALKGYTGQDRRFDLVDRLVETSTPQHNQPENPSPASPVASDSASGMARSTDPSGPLFSGPSGSSPDSADRPADSAAASRKGSTAPVDDTAPTDPVEDTAPSDSAEDTAPSDLVEDTAPNDDQTER